MEISIRSFAMVREILGDKLINLEVKQNADVQEVLATLIRQYPQVSKVLLHNGELLKNYKILLGNEEVSLSTKVNENNVIIIIPPTGGG